MLLKDITLTCNLYYRYGADKRDDELDALLLADYLREFRTKLTAKKENLGQVTISASASQREKTQALKEIDKIEKTLDEISEYEHEVLYPLAA